MTETNRKRYVAIVTPNYDGYPVADYQSSVMKAQVACLRRGWDFMHRTIAGCAILPWVRNQIVAEALAEGVTDVFLIDDDIGFEDDLFVAMVEAEEDIVGVAPQKRMGNWREKPLLAWRALDDQKLPESGTYMEVRGVSTAFARVKAHVFTGIIKAGVARRQMLEDSDPKIWPFLAQYFDYGVHKIVPPEDARKIMDEAGIPEDMRVLPVGEDYFFCDLAREAGFKVYLDMMAGVRHWEGRCCHDYTFREAIIDAQKVIDAAMAPAPAPALLTPTNEVVSVCIASKGRPANLMKMLASLEATAANPEKVTVIVGCNHDDFPTHKALEDYTGRLDLRCAYFMDKPLGAITDGLARGAKGDVIVSGLTDDQVMITPQWDQIIRNVIPGLTKEYAVGYFETAGVVKGFASTAVVAPRTRDLAVETLKCFNPPWFPFWFADTWWDDVADMAGVKSSLPIHMAPQATEGPQTQNLRDVTFWAKLYHAAIPLREKLARALCEARGHRYTDAEMAERVRLTKQRQEHLLTPEFAAEWEGQRLTEPSPAYQKFKAAGEDALFGLTAEKEPA